MPAIWAQESCDRYDDPISGARVIQLTSAAAISNNIYGEQPYTSPDGKRIIIARCNDFCFDTKGSLLVHELDTLRITMVERSSEGVRGVFNNAWSGLCYYWNPARELVQISLMTLEKKVVYKEENPDLPLLGSSVSPDQRYIIGLDTRMKGKGAPIFQIVRLDLKKQIREVIYEDPEIANPHLQFNPITGKQILVQNNRGLRMAKDGSLTYRHTQEGTTLFVMDVDGKNKRYVPVGQPLTASSTGHECFLADSGRILFSVSWNFHSFYHLSHDSRYPQGNIFTAKPGDKKPTVFAAPEHFFNHVSASRDGKYFLADSLDHGYLFESKTRAIRPVSLVVGNLKTGKYRTLVQDTMASGGGNQCTHTHPYLTADNRYAIYNADPYYGPAQVFAAKLPEDFLKSLD